MTFCWALSWNTHRARKAKLRLHHFLLTFWAGNIRHFMYLSPRVKLTFIHCKFFFHLHWSCLNPLVMLASLNVSRLQEFLWQLQFFPPLVCESVNDVIVMVWWSHVERINTRHHITSIHFHMYVQNNTHTHAFSPFPALLRLAGKCSLKVNNPVRNVCVCVCAFNVH